MIDLSSTRRKDGKTAREALRDEPFGFALSWSPDHDPDDLRTLVIRWPAFVTFALVMAILAFVAGCV